MIVCVDTSRPRALSRLLLGFINHFQLSPGVPIRFGMRSRQGGYNARRFLSYRGASGCVNYLLMNVSPRRVCEHGGFGTKVRQLKVQKTLPKGFEMKMSLSPEALAAVSERLTSSNQQFMAGYPGESGRRQPVHTVYGGAHLFRADSAQRLGQVAQRALVENASDFVVFARATGLPLSSGLPDVLDYATGLKHRLESEPDAVRNENKAAWLAYTIHSRVQEQLNREPVEDFRIDFE